MRMTKPDCVFVDDEGMGGFDSWRLHVASSQNAMKRRRPGETLDSLAYRMADGMLAQWSQCLNSKADFPGGPPRIFFYGMGPAPDAIMNKNGFTGTPSPYGPVHHLSMYADWLKVLKQGMLDSGKGRQFLPWITGGTYGDMSSSAVLDGMLHSYGVGATGFAFFSAADFDDGGKILAMSTATALAAPFEDYFLQGSTLTSADVDESQSENVLAWSGMKYEQQGGGGGVRLWVVITPSKPGRQTTLHFTIKGMAITACDLVGGAATTLSKAPQTVRFEKSLQSSAVLHIAEGASSGPGCDKSQPIAKNMWWPE